MSKEVLTSIKVVIRIRPVNKIDYKQGNKSSASSSLQLCINVKPDNQTIELIKDSFNSKFFSYDFIFSSSSTQFEVYKQSCSDLIQSFLTGYHASILCYGQTGTGKTFTMFGSMNHWNQPLQSESGMLQQSLNDIFQYISFCQQEGRFVRLSFSFYEVYLETIHDLLLPSTTSTTSTHKNKINSLNIRESLEKGVYVEGLSVFVITNPEDVYQLIQNAVSNRVTFGLEMNETSSRSHAILQLSLEQEIFSSSETTQFNSTKGGNENKRILKNVLTFCDLAGSERVHRVGSNGVRLREAQHINRSICALGNCIQSLAIASLQRNKRKQPGAGSLNRNGINLNNNLNNNNQENGISHIPFRDSKLTRLLSEALSGNSRTCIISTIGPCMHSYEETLSTLIFSTRAAAIRKNIKQVKPTSGIFSDLSETIQNWKWPPPKSIALNENGNENGNGNINDDENDREIELLQHNQHEELLGSEEDLPPLPPPSDSPPPLPLSQSISVPRTNRFDNSTNNNTVNNKLNSKINPPQTPNFLQDGQQMSPIHQIASSTKKLPSTDSRNPPPFETSYLYPVSPEELTPPIEINKSPLSVQSRASTPPPIPQRRHSFSDSRRKIQLHPTIVMKRLSEETQPRGKSPISQRMTEELNGRGIPVEEIESSPSTEPILKSKPSSTTTPTPLKLNTRRKNQLSELLYDDDDTHNTHNSNNRPLSLQPSLEMLASEDFDLHYLHNSPSPSPSISSSSITKQNRNTPSAASAASAAALNTNSETIPSRSVSTTPKSSSKAKHKTNPFDVFPTTPSRHFELRSNNIGMDDLANTLEKELNKFRLDHNLHEISPYEINDDYNDYPAKQSYPMSHDELSQISQLSGNDRSISSNHKLKPSYSNTPSTPKPYQPMSQQTPSALQQSMTRPSNPPQIIPSPVRITISRDLVKLSHVPPPPPSPPPLLSQPSPTLSTSPQSIKSVVEVKPLPPLMIDQSTSVDLIYSDKSTNTPLPTPNNINPCPNCSIAKGEIISLKNEVCGYVEEINYLKELLQPNLHS